MTAETRGAAVQKTTANGSAITRRHEERNMIFEDRYLSRPVRPRNSKSQVETVKCETAGLNAEGATRPSRNQRSAAFTLLRCATNQHATSPNAPQAVGEVKRRKRRAPENFDKMSDLGGVHCKGCAKAARNLPPRCAPLSVLGVKNFAEQP